MIFFFIELPHIFDLRGFKGGLGHCYFYGHAIVRHAEARCDATRTIPTRVGKALWGPDRRNAVLTRTLLHERLGFVTSQSTPTVSGEVATSEATGGKFFLGVLIGAAVVGGVAAIVLSGGTAVPAIIVALEAAGDVTVGTELVDVVIGNTP